MPLAAWVRERLWRASDWLEELSALRKVVLGEPSTIATAERMLDLAWASELCDPDRSKALGLYVEAWRRGKAAAIPRVKALATALHAHVSIAEVALAEGDLVTAGEAFLDAGLPQLAIEPLQRSLETAADPRARDELQTLIALARRTDVDAERAIATSVDRGRYVHASRVARLADLRAHLPTIFAAAIRAAPDDELVHVAAERWLLEQGDADQLLAHYRAWFERAATRAVYLERVRAAGVELIAREVQPGLGLRLLRMSLKHAYEAHCPEVTSHIAAWELIVAHARSQKSTVELVPLLVEAMASPVSTDVAVYLARLGLEIAWRDAGDTLAAQPYAAMLLDFVGDHPLATKLAKEIETTTGVHMSFANPSPAPVASTSKPRFVLGDEGSVKRAEPPAATPRKQAIGRLALLTPPTPRTTTLRRDASPIPTVAPRSAKPTWRAPRKVVPIDVMVEMANGSWFSTVLRDVSTSGAFILTKRPVEIGSVVSLEMRIPTPGTLTQVSHRTNAKIARRTDVGWGLAFVDSPKALIDVIRAMTE